MNGGTKIKLADRFVGDGEPVYLIAEIGINHNGSVELCKKLVDAAKSAGCDAVKFQKRTPELCGPRDQWNIERDTPWGRMTYIAYRHKIELDHGAYAEVDRYCRAAGLHWFASCWDEEAVDFMERFEPPCYKVASASLTDTALLRKLRSTGRPVLASTGMSTMDEIVQGVEVLGRSNLGLAHSTSMYPCAPEHLNLRMITTLRTLYPDVPIGYSGHETGLVPTLAAVSLGATFVERHITLDRAMWGTDQAASVEPGGLARLVAGVRDIERALGDGMKRVYDGELSARAKLRRVASHT